MDYEQRLATTVQHDANRFQNQDMQIIWSKKKNSTQLKWLLSTLPIFCALFSLSIFCFMWSLPFETSGKDVAPPGPPLPPKSTMSEHWWGTLVKTVSEKGGKALLKGAVSGATTLAEEDKESCGGYVNIHDNIVNLYSVHYNFGNNPEFSLAIEKIVEKKISEIRETSKKDKVDNGKDNTLARECLHALLAVLSSDEEIDDIVQFLLKQKKNQ